MTYDKPLCKKCIPEYISSKQKPQSEMSQQQKMNNARLLGMGSLALNQFQSEKSQISRSLERISNLKRDFRILDSEIQEREKFSETFVKDLPPLMSSMFDKLEELVQEAEHRFEHKIVQVVRQQQRNIEEDIKTKLP